MLRNCLILVFLFGIIGRLFAQQDPIFTQYMHIPVLINPAYAGSRGDVSLVALNRQQWIGIDGAPKTMAISLNSPLIDKVGVGLSLLYDEIGPVKQTRIYTDYSYHINLTAKIKLAFGLKGGMDVYYMNLRNLVGAQNETNFSFNGEQKMRFFNFGVGSYLYSDRFYAGFSIPRMLQNSLSENTNTLHYINKEDRHLFLTAGTVIDIAENIKFKPSTEIRLVNGSPISAELSAAVLLHEKIWLGAMYRHHDSLGALIRFNLTDLLSIGYSYDLSTSQLRLYNQGTHEVFISYDLILNTRKILSPRYF